MFQSTMQTSVALVRRRTHTVSLSIQSSLRFFSSATVAPSSSSSDTLPRPTSDGRGNKSRYQYVRAERTATWQATRRVNGESILPQQQTSTPATISVTPIEAAIAADQAASQPASSSTALSVPEGSQPYSGRSAVSSAPIPDFLFQSRAVGQEARAKKMSLAISPQKLNDICRTVRGLSVTEAMIQLKLSHKPKAAIVRQLIASAASNATNTLDMERSRLYIDRLWVGHGSHLKRLDIKGRGRTGMKLKYRSHLFVVLKEQGRDSEAYKGIWKHGGNSHDPRTGEELRIGRVGRKISTIERTLASMKEWRLARGMEAQPRRVSHHRAQQGDAKKAFESMGVKTDLEAIFGKAAIEAAAQPKAQKESNQ